jgi:predicted protein tyrosine phosphatase
MSNLNRMANAKNPFQGDAKKVLCVCSAGLLRSPTAANVLNREFYYNTRAVGHTQEYALIHVEEVHLYWADEVVCVNKDTLDALDTKFRDSAIWNAVDKAILSIPDQYMYGDSELEELILKQYEETQDE